MPLDEGEVAGLAADAGHRIGVAVGAVGADAVPDVGVVEAGRGHLQQHLAGLGLGHRGVGVVEHVEPAMAARHHRLHGRWNHGFLLLLLLGAWRSLSPPPDFASPRNLPMAGFRSSHGRRDHEVRRAARGARLAVVAVGIAGCGTLHRPTEKGGADMAPVETAAPRAGSTSPPIGVSGMPRVKNIPAAAQHRYRGREYERSMGNVGSLRFGEQPLSMAEQKGTTSAV